MALILRKKLLALLATLSEFGKSCDGGVIGVRSGRSGRKELITDPALLILLSKGLAECTRLSVFMEVPERTNRYKI